MTPRDELIEAMAKGMSEHAQWEERWAAFIPSATAALTAIETFLAAKGWKITGPVATDAMEAAADEEDDPYSDRADGSTHWEAMHAAAPNLLEDADAG